MEEFGLILISNMCQKLKMKKHKFNVGDIIEVIWPNSNFMVRGEWSDAPDENECEDRLIGMITLQCWPILEYSPPKYDVFWFGKKNRQPDGPYDYFWNEQDLVLVQSAKI